MDRGQPERPAEGSDEAIEAIDAVGAPADDDVSDESTERGPSNEVSPPSLAPTGGPPAHWLAYVRARAPWLLTRDGGLAAPTHGPTPDIVPHGPAAHPPPWPPPETPTPAQGVAGPTRPGDAAVAQVPVAGPGDPWAGEESVHAHVPGQAPGPHRPDAFAAPAGPVGRREREGLPQTRHPPATRREDMTFASDELDERRGDPPDPVGARRDASGADDQVPAQDVTSGGPAETDRAPSRIPSVPQPDWPSLARSAVSWPPFAAEPPRGTRGAEAPRPNLEPTPQAARFEPPMASPPRPSTAGHAPPAFPPLAPPSPADRPITETHRPDSWRVRAAAPNVRTVAQLDLPPWPDLPDPMLEAMPEDDVAWRSIERRLDRTARLEREQRRR
jgi:hypothetical protein